MKDEVGPVASRFHLEACGPGKRALSFVEGEEPPGSRQYGCRNMKSVRRPASNALGMIRAQLLGFAKGIRPGQGDMDQDAIRQIFLDLPEGPLPFLTRYLATENCQPQAVEDFKTMQRIERKLLRMPRHKPPRCVRIRIVGMEGDKERRIRVRCRRNHNSLLMAS